MLERKAIAWFTLRAGIVAVLLLYPWPWVVSGYASLFRAGADVVFTRYWFWPQGSVRFLDLNAPKLRSEIDLVTPGTLPAQFRPPPPQGVLDTLMVLRNRQTPGSFGVIRVSSRGFGYWSTAWFLVLLLAKSMSWRRRGRGLFWGLILLHGFIVFRISLQLAVDGFGADKTYALFVPPEFWFGILGRLEEVFVENPTVSFVVPTFIWFLVAFERKEWAALRGGLDAQETDAPG